MAPMNHSAAVKAVSSAIAWAAVRTKKTTGKKNLIGQLTAGRYHPFRMRRKQARFGTMALWSLAVFALSIISIRLAGA